ncbi:MFS transporter [Lactobacillus hamsteri]|uniref:MFS transporter n=1 Tax=Lactobacillus hamsteri TaxID=96565 RepID=UPI0022A9F0B6|nr:MFS transporter [Lactobacillus hamsteri]
MCFIIGFMCGAFLSGRLKTKIKTISFTWILSSIPLFLMLIFISNWIIFSFLILIFGFLTSLQNILSESMIQITSNDEYLGHVLTTIRTGTSIGGPISSIIGGLLDYSGYEILILICALFVICGGINMLFSK